MNNEILVFAEHKGARTQYIIETLLCDFQGFQIRFAEDLKSFIDSDLPKFSYLHEGLRNIPNIFNSQNIENDTLFETEPDFSQNIKITEKHLSRDLFCDSFYMLSRAEEYHYQQPDSHGRFPAEASAAFQNNSAYQPLADINASLISRWLVHHYPDLQHQPKKPSVLLSFDIDIAWAFRNKPFIRQSGAFAKDILSGNFNKFANRISVLRGKKKDPFDIYQNLELLFQTTQIPMIFFFQMRSEGRYDKAVRVKSREFSHLVRNLSEFAEIGIHPSYSGGQNKEMIIEEKAILEDIIGTAIRKSRQHFLKLHIPKTPRILSEAGISDDYSMGFADQIGWRAGTCRPFRIFDLELNKSLPLKTHPISVMDGTLREYLNLTPTQAMQKMQEIIRITMDNHGEFIPLWHNESLSNTGKWSGWNENVFMPMVKLMKEYINTPAS